VSKPGLTEVGTSVANSPLSSYVDVGLRIILFSEEIIMKSLVLFAALLFAITLSNSSLVASKAAPGGKKQAVTVFTEPTRLMGVVLKGEYLFVHDDAAMARGEACTFVYKGNAPVASKLVVSFHCVPAERTKAGTFTVRMSAVSGFQEVIEYQFSGETEAHTVPAGK
jgi:hypothetical protein